MNKLISLFKKVGTWFTPKRRKSFYVAATAIGGALLAAGVLTPDSINNATGNLNTLSNAILALTGVLAALNVNSSDGDQ